MRWIESATMVVIVGCIAFVKPLGAQTLPSPYTTGYRYDAMRRLTGTISPDPDASGPLKYGAVRKTYDHAGFLTKVERGELSSWQSQSVAPSTWAGFTVFHTTDISYDSLHRKVQEFTRVGSSGSISSLMQYSYDAAGRLECIAVRMNFAIYASLPASACTLGAVGNDGPDRITKNVHDAAGRLVQVRKAVGTVLEQADATYSYTSNSQREYVIDASGNRAKLEYDGFDRQVKWIFPSTTVPTTYNSTTPANALATAGALSTADMEQYSYDVSGNRTGLKKRDGRFVCQKFDALNRITSKFYLLATATLAQCQSATPSGTNAVYSGYDLRGLQTYARFGSASGQGISNVWDGFGRLNSSTSNMGGGTLGVIYQYDANGNRTRVTHPDGPYFTYEYDGLDRLIRIRENGGTELVGIGYNNKGERTCQGNTVNASACGGSTVTNYAYDGVSRLTSYGHDLSGANSDIVAGLVYNPASQITGMTRSNSAYAWNGHINVNRSYGVNGLNQYTSAGPASFTYDGNGNLTSDGSTAYVYDAENRLTSTNGAKTANLAYDPQGRLWETAGNGVTTRFLYDGDELIAEYASNGMLLRRYIHGVGSDDPLIWYEAGQSWPSGLRRIHTDHQGSVTAIANGAGAMLAINSYDEYGIPASGNLGRFQYTGQAWLPEIGMYYYKARIYSPTLGRFLQTDPIGYDDQINLYAYVANDPINGTDPTGKWNTWGHNWLIRTAFPGLSAHQIGVLQGASKGADAPVYQTADNSSRHGMRSPNQTPAQALAATEALKGEQSAAAQRAQGAVPTSASSINDRALGAYGIGAHAVMDSASPMHRDAQGNPLPWSGNEGPSALAGHVAGELSPLLNPGAAGQAISGMQEYFGQTFGADALKGAMTPPAPPPDPCRGKMNGSVC